MAEEVRRAAVRAYLFFSCTVVALLVASMASLAHSTLLMPALLTTALGVFGTAWGLIDIVIARQIAAQRRRGPNSASPLAGAKPQKAEWAGRQERTVRPALTPVEDRSHRWT
ncbi:hypothetical protein CFP65_6736 [Kitasatospora sp. MMS16-BH015]|nr:hypothetical protein CFP65_6736 [Kitasatospora sp. MMS16-BH015]